MLFGNVTIQKSIEIYNICERVETVLFIFSSLGRPKGQIRTLFFSDEKVMVGVD